MTPSFCVVEVLYCLQTSIVFERVFHRKLSKHADFCHKELLEIDKLETNSYLSLKHFQGDIVTNTGSFDVDSLVPKESSAADAGDAGNGQDTYDENDQEVR